MKNVDLGVKEWEDSILLPLKIMKWCLAVYSVLVIALPIYKGHGLFMDSLFSLACLIVLILGYLSRCGRVLPFNTMFFVALIRGLNFLADIFFLKKVSLNLVVWVFLIFIELSITFFYLLDSSRYECVKELEEK